MSGNHGRGPKEAPRWTKADIAKAADMLRAGMSAGQMAPHFGITRNAVCGRVHREPELRKIGFDRHRHPASKKPAHLATSRFAKTAQHPVQFQPNPKRIAAALARAFIGPIKFACRGIPLLDLACGDCRWIINDPAPHEGFLFCANPAEHGSYCRPHFLRSIGDGTISERRAGDQLRRAA